MTSPGGSPFRVLVVCTGNICRSPQAAELLQAALDDAGDPWRRSVTVTSAGTRAVEGSSMDASAADCLVSLGGDPTRHRAQQVTVAMIDNADLVICMTREHRQAVARLCPASSRYTFLLTELSALVDSAVSAGVFAERGLPTHSLSDPTLPSCLREGVRFVAARRGLTERPDPSTLDVPDPYRRSAKQYRASAGRIQQCVEQLHDSVAAALSRSSP